MCIFCRLVEKDLPSYIIYEDELFMVFLDVSQATPGHTLVVTKKHVANILALDDELANKILPVVTKITKAIAKAFNTKDFNIINNCGAIAGQTVDHFHIHIIPRYDDDGLKVVLPSNKFTPEKLNDIKQNIIKNL